MTVKYIKQDGEGEVEAPTTSYFGTKIQIVDFLKATTKLFEGGFSYSQIPVL